MKQTYLWVILAVLVGLPVLGLLSMMVPGRAPMSQNMYYQTEDGAADVVSSAPSMRAGQDSKLMIAPGEPYPMPPVEEGGFTPDVDRTIVKTAQLSLLVDDTRATVDKISQTAQQFSGFVTSSNVYESGYQKGALQAEMTLRVPVDQMDQALNAIRAVAGKVISENISSVDQTEIKVDLEAQLRNLKATEEQLLALLKQATNVEETLQVQRELNTTRSQIERMTAQLENLEGSANMSTIYVSITTKESELPITDRSQLSLMEELKLSVKQALSLYRELAVAGLRLVIIGLPIWLIAGLIFWLRRRRK